MAKQAENWKRLLQSDTVKAIGKNADAQPETVRKVLACALPEMISGIEADSNSDRKGLEKALGEHAKNDTSDMTAFLKNADAGDGEKILSYFLGDKKDELLKSTAKKAGISREKTLFILALCAPLILSLLGKDGGEANAEDVENNSAEENENGGILGSLLGGAGSEGLANVLLGSLLGSSSHSGSNSQFEDLSGALLQTLLDNTNAAQTQNESHSQTAVTELAQEAGESILGSLLGSGSGNGSGNEGSLLNTLFGRKRKKKK